MNHDLSFGTIAGLLGLAVFLGGHDFRRPLPVPEIVLSVAAPIPLQVIAAAGDRYLAANVAVWRVLMTGAQPLPRDSLAALARVQEDASFLNPGHEDNYTTATALLPWEGFVEPTQTVLRRATETRKTDVYAPFFYGFNQIHFLGDAKGAYEYGRIAASYARDEGTRQALLGISASWLERGNDPALASQVIAVLASELRDPDLKAQLMQRVERQQRILRLQEAVDAYRQSRGRAPDRLEALVAEGFIATLPQDPLGTVVFRILPNGRVGFRAQKK
ncbi:MAG: hypothetical protein E6Q43_02640 [Dokdonella sp.]|nr:MAG: hypothetical protein E6Q43_02640 [Dokdonella sp.]